MANIEKRPLKVFLCHASGDKPPVRDLYKRLSEEGVDAWLDKEKLLPGQDWRLEIPKAVKEADVVVVCLSTKSVTKEGYVQKEIKFALDIAEEKPEGAIFLIPARLEDCTVPERLSRWHWVDLYEENGFIQLLRSLKLRAGAVGATVEPTAYEDSDKEVEQRVDQLYTEGLAAFYTEDWDRACHRFQSILSERPSHKHATEKLAEAEWQRNLAKLYIQSTEAYKSENWPAAIKTLEELSQKSADYKDVAQLLKNARKQRQLKALYAEAKTLHTAKKWQAVVKVFEQISAIDSTYPDLDGLLPSAQKEAVELKRLADLNDLYSHAVREMDAGQWYEARRLLEQVHKAQIGFLETEHLLRKVEDEITKVEEHNQRNNEVNVLYEQAHGLLRSKKWRKALDKIEEIQKLEDQFLDKDGISEKAKAELAREEREAQRQNELAAIYAEAVRLLKEEKYQEALDKWQEVKAIDPKYPDRQWVQRTARKRLSETSKPIQIKPRFVISKSLWIGMSGLIVVGAVITGVILSGRRSQTILPPSTSAPIQTAIVIPTRTDIPSKTNTPGSATAVSTTSGYSDPTMYDDFNALGTTIDTNQWSPGGNDPSALITKKSGILTVKTSGYQLGIGISATRFQEQIIRAPFFVEGRFKLEPNQNGGSGIHLSAFENKGGTLCQIWAGNGAQAVHCQSFFDGFKEISVRDITPGTWHSARIEVDPSTMVFTYYIDGFNVGEYIPDRANEFKNTKFSPFIWSGCVGDGCTDKSARTVTGYFDNIRMGAIEDDPTIYENFDNKTYDGRFNTTKWAYDQHDPAGSAVQQDGVLVFTQGGIEKGQRLRAIQYWPFKLQNSMVFEANLNSEMTSSGIVALGLDGDVQAACGLHSMSDVVMAHCWPRSPDIFAIPVAHRTWHTVRIEVNVENNMITFFMDGKKLAEDHYDQPLLGASIYLNIDVSAGPYRVENTRPMIGYVDNVRVYPLEYANP